MNTIRPLATIAILAGLGYMLATQIRQNPAGEADELSANWGEAPAYEGGEAASEAPKFTPPTPPPVEATSAQAGGSEASAATRTAEELAEPEMPDMPPLPEPTGGATASSPAEPSDPGLPALPGAGAPGGEIPMPQEVAAADYSGGAAAGNASAPASAAQASADPMPPAAAPAYEDPYAAYDPSTSSPEPVDASGAPPIGADPASGSGYEPPDAPRYGQSDSTQDLPGAPAAQAAPAYGQADSSPTESSGAAYGAASTGPNQGAGFQAALPMIQSALDNQELRRAHGMLSEWYASDDLTSVERAQVDRLLSQLAGTVIYSTEHLMEPPYIVRAGDTMESIAEQYNVPWRLLAKINGVPRSDAVRPGQVLKVLRGPFSAVVDLSQGELALMVDGKYAGKFSAQATGAAQTEGRWRVDQKKQTPTTPSRYGPPQSAGKQIVLKNPAGVTIVLDASPTPGAGAIQGRVSVAQADMEELTDILSVGSEVTIRR